MGGVPSLVDWNRTGEETGLLAPAMERPALVIDGLALANQLIDGRPERGSGGGVRGGGAFARGLFGLREGVLDVEGALVERALLEIDGQALDFVAALRLGELARVRVAPGHKGHRERGRFRIERLDE